jgi:hypothetical protein
VKLCVLEFVNDIPVKYDPVPAINQAVEWGIDYMIAQGTGKDWGPYSLGQAAGDAKAWAWR